jgi:zinc transport system substrate-binding protein
MYRSRIAAVIVLDIVCLRAPAPAAVHVVATIYPVADIVRQVGQEQVEVVTLLPPGASPHTFEPTPAQIRAVADARIFVCVGAGLDSWTTKLLAARHAAVTVVTLTDGLSLIGAAAGHGGDPHVWLDPVLVKDHMVPAIVNALSREDPHGRAGYERAAAQFGDGLAQLDADIQRTFAPLASRSYIAFHSAWRYFGQRYGLQEIGVVEAFPGKEPSAHEIAAVVQRARAAQVRVVLIEPQSSPRAAEQIARDIGGRTLLVDDIGGPAVAERSTYIDLLRYDARAFAEALQ